MIDLDIFVYVAHRQLSAIDVAELIDTMFAALNWGSAGAKIWIIVTDNFQTNPDQRVNFIFASEAAAIFRLRCSEIESAPHDLVICFAPFLPSVDIVGQLRQTLRNNSMTSAAVPRIAIEPDGHLVILGGQSDGGEPVLIDRSRCGALHPVYYMQEDLFPCLCLHEQIIGNLDPPADYEHFPDLILAFLRAARRRGFLLVIDNAAVLSVHGYRFNRLAILGEPERMRRDFSDHGAVKKRLAHHPAIAEEHRLRIRAPAGLPTSRSLLLDCSHVEPIYNGSTECAIGLLKGVHLSNTEEWNVSALISNRARSFFGVDDRFPTIRFVPPSDSGQYDVAIRLGQAWSIQTSRDLIQRARSIAVVILDIIGVDIVYAASDGVSEAFQFVGEHADGLIYISEFSRQQFRRRYFTRPDLIESVIHLSLDPANYLLPENSEPRIGEWILVLGNPYEHKDLPRTVDILATAFPFEKFKVVGLRHTNLDNVEVFAGGKVATDVMDRLYADAKCIVFPSFYEGFGLPLLRGLALEKSVIARRSELLHELAGSMLPRGRLIEYSNTMDLLPIMARLLDGREVPSLPLGGNLAAGEVPYGWKSCGALVLEFAKRLVTSENPHRWLARDRCLQYIFGTRP